MFVGQPQPVEIHHRGIWYSGELIGWRHEDDGRVAARVRCRVDGLRHSTWKDLADLRLPDPKHPPHREPFPAVVRRPVPSFLQDDERRRHPPARPAGRDAHPPGQARARHDAAGPRARPRIPRARTPRAGRRAGGRAAALLAARPPLGLPQRRLTSPGWSPREAVHRAHSACCSRIAGAADVRNVVQHRQ